MGIFDFLKGKKKTEARKAPVVIRKKPEPAVQTIHRCGFCGKQISGRATKRSVLNVYICSECHNKAQNLSSHEKVKECRKCGFRYLPGFSQWYYKADNPSCPSCNSSLSERYTFDSLLDMLEGDYTMETGSLVMRIINYGKDTNAKGPKLDLSDGQKVDLLKKLVTHEELFVNYGAYLKLLPMEKNFPDISPFLDAYEKKNNRTPRKTIAEKNAQKPIQAERVTSREGWKKILQNLPVDTRHKDCYFKEKLEDAIPNIEKKINLPSMKTVTLRVADDGKCFVLGRTDSHWHEVWRTGVDEYAFHTHR